MTAALMVVGSMIQNGPVYLLDVSVGSAPPVVKRTDPSFQYIDGSILTETVSSNWPRPGVMRGGSCMWSARVSKSGAAAVDLAPTMATLAAKTFTRESLGRRNCFTPLGRSKACSKMYEYSYSASPLLVPWCEQYHAMGACLTNPGSRPMGSLFQAYLGSCQLPGHSLWSHWPTKPVRFCATNGAGLPSISMAVGTSPTLVARM